MPPDPPDPEPEPLPLTATVDGVAYTGTVNAAGVNQPGNLNVAVTNGSFNATF